jgi:dTDP-4-amino-4,6-dideoxygalactose transaminase
LIFGSPTIGDAEVAEVVETLRSGWVGTGPKVARFEGLLADYAGAGHARCLSSCTAALMLALKVLGLGRGDEVLVPAMTFVASANAAEHAGATPVLVDSDPETGLIDLDAAAAAITPSTRAVMPVHLAGRPVDMDRLHALGERHGLAVIEDAAHALGAEWRGRRIGSRILVLRDEEHHDDRGRRARDRRRGGRRAGRATRASRPEPGRVAAVLG